MRLIRRARLFKWTVWRVGLEVDAKGLLMSPLLVRNRQRDAAAWLQTLEIIT